MRKVFSAYKYYNANTRNKDVGDCVKRAISLALGRDYDEVSAELNKLKHDLHAEAFNLPWVYSRYLRKFNIVPENLNPTAENSVTESEFAEAHPNGTYILEVGKAKLSSYSRFKSYPPADHLVTIIDGDIYDSWDSSDDVVHVVYKVKEEPTSFNSYDMSNVLDAVVSYIEELLPKYKDQYIDELSATSNYRVVDKDTAKFFLRFHTTSAIPKDCPYIANRYYSHKMILKCTPASSEEENIVKLKVKCKQKVYDYFYNVKKAIKDSVVAQSPEIKVRFSDDRRFVASLPQWCWSLITNVDISSDSYVAWSGIPKYIVYMDALDGDPRKDESPEVRIEGDTLTELKRNLEYYRKTFQRPNYDY